MRGYPLYVGCSGFSYKDWVGTFYPPATDRSDFLTYYERFFSVVEINYTFYSMPHPFTMEGFITKTSSLRFSIKANRVFTHVRDYSPEDVERFLKGVTPILESDRFIALLFQFPQSFSFSEEAMAFLRRLSGDFAGIDRAVELRGRSWNRAEAFEEISLMGFALVSVDAPKESGVLVGPWKSVGSFNYVRLHGRNGERWHNHKKPYERYDYLYSVKELKEIKEKVLKLSRSGETYVFFNNHYRGKGVLNALWFKELLGERVSVPKSLSAAFSRRLWE